MLSEKSMRLEAIDRTRNVFRSWRCEIDHDLFGATLVSVTFGRIGSDGRTIRRAVADESAALALVRRLLMRRATSVKRCGAAYRVVACDGLDGSNLVR
jgi:predicted DNA-binding WGR domain protein